MKNVIVIGGGPAGMIAAGIAAKNGNKTILIEKNEKLGKKLYITGKGRCNLTNASDPETLIKNITGNPYFLYSAFYTFTSQDTMEFFEKLGVRLKVERGNRVFPVSDKSSDIIKALERYLKINKVDVLLKKEVDDIIIENKLIKGVHTKDNKLYLCDNLIIATGGLSYPVTGSTGDGYRFAKKAGHNVTKLYPSIVPLVSEEKWCSELQGLTLKNVSINLNVCGKTIYKDFGEMLFTHFGVSGPIILSASRFIIDKIDKKPQIIIDVKPSLNEKELDNRILRDFKKYKNKAFKNSLSELLPKKLIPVIIKLSEIDENKQVNEITKEERKKLVYTLKNITINIKNTRDFSEAVITAGGVDVNDIEPSTMKSKIIDNLSFAGEVIDTDGFTGGFNLQIAFSTGYLAGNNI